MILDEQCFRSNALPIAVRVFLGSASLLEDAFLGSKLFSSVHQARRIGYFHFGLEDESAVESYADLEITRNFDTSFVRCSSNGQAVAFLSGFRHSDNRERFPAALSFAFAQQWARADCACVHGALLNVGGQGILVLGARAAGKSVLSASALAAAGGIITDDFLLLGASGDVIIGERIRQFISLRRSWAAETLMDDNAEEWVRTANRMFLRVKDDVNQFPLCTQIDKIWVLNRPQASRSCYSSLEKISNAEVYAALVSAIQPLLLGTDFPHERAKLQALLGKLMSRVPAARIETGQDIVLDPKGTWERLLG